MSGRVANSLKLTLMTPSVAGIGVGKGSVVSCASAGELKSKAVTVRRLRNMS
jgi:hypothetical protein